VSKHEHFEELAAIAALGELSPLQFEDLSFHLAECSQCRRVHDEYVELHAPLRQEITPETDAVIESRREKIKSAVLQTVAAEDARALLEPHAHGQSNALATRWRPPRPAWTALAVASVCSLAFWLGIRYDHSVLGSSRQPVDIVPGTPVQAVQTIANAALQADLRKEPANRGKEYEKVANDLRMEKLRSARLDTALIEKDRALSESQNERVLLRQQLDARTQNARRAEFLFAAKTQELIQAEATNANDFSAVASLRYQVQELTEKLNAQAQSVKREQQLLADGRDIRDIVGARNLHIIDVYDAGPEGTRSKSFARAFYTEGKSLIFYAYDLPARRTENGRFAFTAWGERNGDKKTVRNLGILLNDDKGQSRWVLNFSDPQVLAEIDSVFVTLERADGESERPTGKRMLTAYLDSRVNHP
jgi:hypothetical protein